MSWFFWVFLLSVVSIVIINLSCSVFSNVRSFSKCVLRSLCLIVLALWVYSLSCFQLSPVLFWKLVPPVTLCSLPCSFSDLVTVMIEFTCALLPIFLVCVFNLYFLPMSDHHMVSPLFPYCCLPSGLWWICSILHIFDLEGFLPSRYCMFSFFSVLIKVPFCNTCQSAFIFYFFTALWNIKYGIFT